MSLIPMTTPVPADAVCVVNHPGTGEWSTPCHEPATHLIRHERWRKAMPCCGEVAHWRGHRGSDWQVVAIDALRWEQSG